MKRCDWATSSPLEMDYHDQQWGVPVHDDRLLFEMLILEGAQAGLSWSTILQKRAGYKKAFDNFDVSLVATYDDDKKAELLLDPGIVRNRLKVNAAVTNAQLFLSIQKDYGSFDQFIWAFVDHQPIINHWEQSSTVPATSSISDKLSKDLKKRGFKFVGSTICYAYMQAIGMVNDHLVTCFRHAEV